MKELLDSYVESGKELQLKFRNDAGPPIGPAKVERLEVQRPSGSFEPGDAGALVPIMLTYTYYRMCVPAQAPGQRRVMIVPIVFSADDVMWVTEGPQEAAESPIVTTSGKTSPGGIHLG